MTTVVLTLSLLTFAALETQSHSCLPPGLKPSDVVSAERSRDGSKLVTVTVKQRLKQLHARCIDGTPRDSSGREVRFYRVHCFGAQTQYAMETMQRERTELDSLRQQYTVIEMKCNPTGAPTP